MNDNYYLWDNISEIKILSENIDEVKIQVI